MTANSRGGNQVAGGEASAHTKTKRVDADVCRRKLVDKSPFEHDDDPVGERDDLIQILHDQHSP